MLLVDLIKLMVSSCLIDVLPICVSAIAVPYTDVSGYVLPCNCLRGPRVLCFEGYCRAVARTVLVRWEYASHHWHTSVAGSLQWLGGILQPASWASFISAYLTRQRELL